MAIKKSGEIETLLLGNGVKPSPARILVMRVLEASEKPLSVQEIEDRIDTLDRSTITRTLPVLDKAHLIHSLSDGSGSMRYEICHSSERNYESHDDRHAHFHCRVCGETTCFKEMVIEIPEIPEGFKAENISLIITGVCPVCRQS